MSSVNEETKQSLPPGDPQAGNTTHDTAPVFQTGTVPDVEQEAYDEREKARQEQVDAIAEAEDKVAKERQAGTDDAEAKASTSKATASKTTSSSTSSSS